MYRIELTAKANKFLRKLPKKDAEIILNKLYSIRQDPFVHIKRLVGAKLYRLRIMDYRAVLDILVAGRRIVVIRVGHRENVYDIS